MQGGSATQIPAGSSTADSTVDTPRVDMESWTPAQRDDYFLTGKAPETKTAEPASQTGSAADAAKSATGEEPGATQGAEPSAPGAEKRIKALLARVKELEGKQAPPAAAEPGTETKPGEKKETKAADDPRPVKPKSTDFDTWEAYEDARDEYTDKLAAWRSREAIANYQTQQEQRQQQARVDAINTGIQESWQARVEAVKGKPEYKDYDAVVTEQLQVNQVSSRFILDSPHGAEMAYFLAKNPEEAGRLAKLSPSETMREIVALEANFKPAEKKEAPKEKRTLPEPETVLSGGAAATADPVEAAVKAGDVGTYMRLANARDAAR